MTIRSLITAGALAAMMLSTVAARAADGEVTIALEGAYAPWNLTDAEGKIVGFEPELAAVLCAHAKLKCTLI